MPLTVAAPSLNLPGEFARAGGKAPYSPAPEDFMANNDKFDLQRRRLMKLGAGAGAAVAFTSPFEVLAHGGRKSGPGYGDLVEAIDETTGLPLLKLPKGFRYLSFGWTGDPLEDGKPTPGGHDGGAVLDGAYGRVYYVRNHELSYNTRGATASSLARR